MSITIWEIKLVQLLLEWPSYYGNQDIHSFWDSLPIIKIKYKSYLVIKRMKSLLFLIHIKLMDW